MPTPPYLPLTIGAALLVVASKRRRRSSYPTAPSHQMLDLGRGPEVDPCLGAAYSQDPQPLLAEAYQGIKDSAKALYGNSAVFYLSPEAQAQAFVSVATLRVNQPGVEPVIRTAQQIAPDCDWLSPDEDWSPAMIAFRNSLEKMVQIVDEDTEGALPPRLHAWENRMLLRNGNKLKLEDGEPFNFELPSQSAAVAITVSPANAARVIALGRHQQLMLVGAEQTETKPAVFLFGKLANGVSSAVLLLQASSPVGITSGTVTLVRQI